VLAKPGLARNSPSHPCGPLSAGGGQLCSVLKQGALDASPGAMRNPVWLRASAPQMGPRTYRPGPLATAGVRDEVLARLALPITVGYLARVRQMLAAEQAGGSGGTFAAPSSAAATGCASLQAMRRAHLV